MQTPCPIEKALARKYPEPVVLVTTRFANGKPNVMACAWVALASSDPWMFVLAIDAESRTYKLILKTKQFVVAFPHEGMDQETKYAGTHHGHGQDKLAEAGLAAQAASKVKAPLIRDALANFECQLVETHHPGDCPLIVGQVVAAHLHRAPGLQRLFVTGPKHRLGGLRPM